MEELARKLLEGKNLVYIYNDGARPHIMKNWHFMGIHDGMARFYYGGELGYMHEVNMTADSLFQLKDKGSVKYSCGTLKYLS